MRTALRFTAVLLGAIATPAWSQPSRAGLDLVLMLDVSQSVSHPGFIKTDRTLPADGAAAIAAAIEPIDRVRLGVFGAAIAITPEPLSGAALAQAAAAFGAGDAVGGPSPVWDALDRAATALEGSTGRRAIIVVTDGRSTANRIGFSDILQRLERDRLPVFVVMLDLKRSPTPDPGVRMRELADRTGGSVIVVKREGAWAGIKRAVTLSRR
jgi:uncharacterized protein with von Willebrand factor type A (vWA) domain